MFDPEPHPTAARAEELLNEEFFDEPKPTVESDPSPLVVTDEVAPSHIERLRKAENRAMDGKELAPPGW